ncbi:MAG: hypothetical protein CYG60_12635 [Actinobacteria bacterium]|jgi:Uma2 family endonuclease|nr:Uma2 family endonuclease [Actinomycetota bacterium]PLS85429.1 MAG: hypothetical protein CYG60_12635 [Actinomycetota bacterium]
METKVRTGYSPMVLHMGPIVKMSEEQFFQFCRLNDEWRIERTAEGDLEIMPPTGGGTGSRNLKLVARLGLWTEQDGTGVAFDSSTGFILPNGATRSPDASWVRRERLVDLSSEQKERFLPLCPDFAVELRSPSDRLEGLQDKMREYLENGARLGWLIDPEGRGVYVYEPGKEVRVLHNPNEVSGGTVLSGFSLDLRQIWAPGF